ncbi:MAG: peptidase domain-containing ABC transporter [Betaproteobacteria bacterium]|nr:peptidase domain-containing ABC transporter [Betaproteobacteria bacterium]
MRIGAEETLEPEVEQDSDAGEKRAGEASSPQGLDDTEGGGHTALRCLVAVAAHFGIATSRDKLVLEHGLSAREPSCTQLVSVAQKLGMRARAEKLRFERLVALDRAYPVIARLDNGNSVVVAGIHQTADGARVAIFDPLAVQTGVFLLEAERFQERWTGEVVFVQREYRLSDPDQPFGLRWFVPELLRQGQAFRDVAIGTVALYVVALAVPIFFQLVIDKVVAHESTSTLYVLTVGVTLALLFESVFGFVRQYLLLYASNKIDLRLATRTFSHLLALPIDYFESCSAGVVVRHMQQAEKIRQFLTGRLFLTLLDACALLVVVPVLLFYSPRLTAIVFVFAAAIAAIVASMIGPFRRRLLELYNAEAEKQAMLVEAIHGMRTVKTLAIEPIQRRKWDDRTAAAIRTHFRVGKIGISAQAATGFLEKAMVVAIIAFGAQAVFDHQLTIGALIAFQMLSGRVITPLVQIVSLVQEYQETALSVRMLGTVMNHAPEQRRTSGLTPPLTGTVELDRVSFRYAPGGNPVVDQISLRVPAGSLVGIVGKSGSGKTTLTRLMQGLYPVQEGVVRFDGVDIREIDLPHLRRSIGAVLQDSFLFRGSIRENIAATKPWASMEEIIAAAQIAGAHEFIERLPQGFDTTIEENAENFSGGQKQRLAIARALLTQPRFLILDEATSALDPESEAIFLAQLGRIRAGRTVLIISHRLTTLVQCDRIVVLDQGRVADIGPHADLVRRCPIYQRLWTQQTKHL